MKSTERHDRNLRAANNTDRFSHRARVEKSEFKWAQAISVAAII
jgi:hypothetical protein